MLGGLRHRKVSGFRLQGLGIPVSLFEGFVSKVWLGVQGLESISVWGFWV